MRMLIFVPHTTTQHQSLARFHSPLYVGMLLWSCCVGLAHANSALEPARVVEINCHQVSAEEDRILTAFWAHPGSAERVEQLLGILRRKLADWSGTSEWAVRGALAAIAERKLAPAIPLVWQLLAEMESRRDGDLSDALVETLVSLAGHRWTSELSPLCSSALWSVRQWLAIEMIHLADPRAAPCLQELAMDRVVAVSESAILALGAQCAELPSVTYSADLPEGLRSAVASWL